MTLEVADDVILASSADLFWVFFISFSLFGNLTQYDNIKHFIVKKSYIIAPTFILLLQSAKNASEITENNKANYIFDLLQTSGPTINGIHNVLIGT